jgi:LacI family transcriptional regulator
MVKTARPVTIRHVAKAANVSIGTVSRVLKNDPSITPRTSQIVLKAVSDLAYRPLRRRQPPASTLSLQSKSVALVMVGMDRSLGTLPAIAEAVHGAEAALNTAGATLTLFDIPDPSKRSGTDLSRSFDGAIIKGALQGDAVALSDHPVLERLQRIPSVWLLDRPAGVTWGDVAGVDDWQVGAIAARHLFEKGHRRATVINPKPDHVTLSRRQAGFVVTAGLLGMEVGISAESQPGHWAMPLRPTTDVSEVAPLVDRVLHGKESGHRALFCPADSIAVLVYRVLAERGLKVGTDVSVISANNERGLLGALFPTLTSVDIFPRDIGQLAVELLQRRIASPALTAPLQQRMEPRLVEGNSVANLK